LLRSSAFVSERHRYFGYDLKGIASTIFIKHGFKKMQKKQSKSSQNEYDICTALALYTSWSSKIYNGLNPLNLT
jgi:hypothetical protein